MIRLRKIDYTLLAVNQFERFVIIQAPGSKAVRGLFFPSGVFAFI